MNPARIRVLTADHRVILDTSVQMLVLMTMLRSPIGVGPKFPWTIETTACSYTQIETIEEDKEGDA